MKMKKWWVLVACVLFAVSCLSIPAMAEQTHEPVELTMWVTSRNSDEAEDERKAAFLEAHPWITFNEVVKEGDPGNEFYQAVAAGTAPDLIEGSFTMMDKYIAAGIVEPLNRYLDEWDETEYLDKTYLEMFTRDGNVYGLPVQVTPMLFGYNKSLFKAAGLEGAPKTWEEALEMAKKLNDPDGQVAGYATLAAEWTEWFFQYYVWQAGGDLTRENEDGTVTLTFTDPAVIRAAEYYQELAASKVLQRDRTLKFNDLLEQFSRGKIAMMPFAVDWVMDVANRGMDLDDVGLCLPPAGPSGKSATAIAGTCYVINASVEEAKKDAAWTYISWKMGREERTIYFENLASKGAIAPITLPRTDMSITDFAEFPEEYRDVLAGVGEIGRLEFYGKADFGSYVDRAVQKILTDPSADPQKEFAEAQALAEAEALEAFNAANKTK
ncbi:MAG: extracellular solute-binding protein [Clostridiales bacterium]|nr:extracellular solute-binding protein [Clostridiales bacterium]